MSARTAAHRFWKAQYHVLFGAGLLCAAALVCAAASPAALAQSGYPSRPIRIIVPGSPGAGFDTVARLMAPGMGERLGQQVVVENRAGAGTIIGTELVVKAPPDGYTLLMCAMALSINPVLYNKLPYDALRDLAPITQTAHVANVMAVHPSVRVKSVKELIALAKARPGEILYASGGRGAGSHVGMELLASMAGIRLTHVPYKSTAPGMVALLAGEVAVMMASMSATIGHVRAGRLRALGVSSARRIAAEPDIPTIAETGLPGYESGNWFGLLAPAATPAETIARLHKEAVAALRAPGVRERLAGDGTEVIASSPAEFAAFIKSETVKWESMKW